MNKLALLVLCCSIFVIALSINCVSAQVSGDWNIGPGWSGIDTPTPSPQPSSTPIEVITNVFGAGMGAIAMFAIVPIISVASLIISVVLMTRSGEVVDPKLIVAGAVLVIVVNIFAVIGILILNGVNNAMPVTQFLFGCFSGS